MNMPAEVAGFFPICQQRMAAAHLVIARSGAGTVARASGGGGGPRSLCRCRMRWIRINWPTPPSCRDAGGAILLDPGCVHAR